MYLLFYIVVTWKFESKAWHLIQYIKYYWVHMNVYLGFIFHKLSEGVQIIQIVSPKILPNSLNTSFISISNTSNYSHPETIICFVLVHQIYFHFSKWYPFRWLFVLPRLINYFYILSKEYKCSLIEPKKRFY